MIKTTTRSREVAWGLFLGLCIAGFAALSLTVHAVRKEVLLAEIDLVELKREKQRLETEFQSRASQHQLARWNRVDLGLIAPRADQYIDGRRQLAMLGQPIGPGAPSPIRVARADAGEAERFARREMVSPVSGAPITLASAGGLEDGAGTMLVEAFSDFLIAASPIRQAKAQTGSGFSSEAGE